MRWKPWEKRWYNLAAAGYFQAVPEGFQVRPGFVAKP
jgi:hypothetical protein